MATSTAKTVEQYLKSLPVDRRAAVSAVRDTVNANLPDGYVEGIQYGMISWYVPLERFPDTYNGQPMSVAGLASQKNYMVLHLPCVYSDPALDTWFKKAYAATGKKLDMGKGCVRFKALDALPLDVVGKTIEKAPVEKFLAQYEAVRAAAKKSKPKAKPAKKKQPAKKK